MNADDNKKQLLICRSGRTEMKQHHVTFDTKGFQSDNTFQPTGLHLIYTVNHATSKSVRYYCTAFLTCARLSKFEPVSY